MLRKQLLTLGAAGALVIAGAGTALAQGASFQLTLPTGGTIDINLDADGSVDGLAVAGVDIAAQAKADKDEGDDVDDLDTDLDGLAGDDLDLDLDDNADNESNDHGEAVSTMANTTELEGCERGQAIAGLARGDYEDQAAAEEAAENGDFDDKCANDDEDEFESDDLEADDDEDGDDDGDGRPADAGKPEGVGNDDADEDGKRPDHAGKPDPAGDDDGDDEGDDDA